MMPIAHMVEWTYKMLAPYGMKVPQLTPSRIRLLSCSRTFSCSKAKDQLSYTPIVSLQVLSCSMRMSKDTFGFFFNMELMILHKYSKLYSAYYSVFNELEYGKLKFTNFSYTYNYLAPYCYTHE